MCKLSEPLYIFIRLYLYLFTSICAEEKVSRGIGGLYLSALAERFSCLVSPPMHKAVSFISIGWAIVTVLSVCLSVCRGVYCAKTVIDRAMKFGSIMNPTPATPLAKFRDPTMTPKGQMGPPKFGRAEAKMNHWS